MKWITILALTGSTFLILTGTAIYSQQTVQDARIQPALIEARQVSNELAEKVRELLLKEMEKGGFINAIKICSEEAQRITHSIRVQKGHSLRRVSLRYRNPRNIPEEHERKRLEEFDRLNREKKLDHEYFEIAREGDKEYLSYMKPLIALPLCMTCHGPKENIPVEVKSILAEKYPGDRATGFLVGDVRGAISVKILLRASK